MCILHLNLSSLTQRGSHTCAAHRHLSPGINRATYYAAVVYTDATLESNFDCSVLLSALKWIRMSLTGPHSVRLSQPLPDIAKPS